MSVAVAPASSDGEARTATTSGSCIRVSNNELRAFQTLGVINFGTREVLETHRVDQQLDALFLNFRITVLNGFIEGEAVLKA